MPDSNQESPARAEERGIAESLLATTWHGREEPIQPLSDEAVALWVAYAKRMARAYLDSEAKLVVLREPLEHLFEDFDEVMREDLRLHDLQQKLGAVFLGYGGGYNHEDDLREALAASEEKGE